MILNKLRTIAIAIAITVSVSAIAQTDSIPLGQINMSQTILNNQKQNPLTIGIYAQLDYNQLIDKDIRTNGKLDVHRLVTYFGYRINAKTHFITEIELEHVSEVYVEQAFLNYAIRPHFNIRGGLMLIPMGIINEYHEPTTYHGVERPNLDGKIVPTTWREMGAGIYGRFDNLSLRYQAYVVNGFMGYDGSSRLRGTDGFRKGRQKGAESSISSPNFTAKVEHYGINGLKLGLAVYSGRTQSTLYNGISRDDAAAEATADSSTVGMTMLGADYRYNYKGFQSRGQFYYTSIQGAGKYNSFTGADIGSAMMGYYVEVAYDLFTHRNQNPDGQKLSPFVRYEKYNTHHKVNADMTQSKAYDRTDITTGLTWHVSPKAAFKADYQHLITEEEGAKEKGQFNMGIGVWF